MIRAGVPQSIAMRVTGHETDAMFNRYDITDNRDKLAARRSAKQQPGEEALPHKHSAVTNLSPEPPTRRARSTARA